MTAVGVPLTGAAAGSDLPSTGSGRLLADVAADPAAPVLVGVSGPAGCGKSGLLADLADTYRAAGLAVHRELTAPAGDAVLLLDDAHALDAGRLTELVRKADGAPLRLVLAYRPWPADPALARLPRTRPEVRLGRLDRAAVALRFGSAAPERVAEVLARTGGQPALVDAELAGDGALDLVRAELDRVPAVVRELLLALSLGATDDPARLAGVLDLDEDAVTDALSCAWSAGLLDDGGRLIGLAAEVLADSTGVLLERETKRRIVHAQLARGGVTTAAGRLLLDVDARGPRAAAALAAAGDEALPRDPALAAECYAGAVTAGAAPVALAARRAEAAVRTGELDTAQRHATDALTASVTDPDRADAPRAAAALATVLGQRGRLAEAGAVSRGGGDVAGAVLALIAVGDPAAGAPAAATAVPYGPALAGSLLAQGLRHTVTGPALAGLSELAQAVRLLGDDAGTALLPEPPAALAALVALQLGEPEVAGGLLARALAGPAGPARALAGPAGPGRLRCLLYTGWIALHHGDLDTAAAVLGVLPGAPLEARDELHAAALALGLARRRTDLPGLIAAWPRARAALLSHPVDLYVLLPLGEIAVAAARLGAHHLPAAHLTQAEALLAALGDPPVWAAPLHWHALHAAIGAEDPVTAVRHVRALQALDPGARGAAELAAAGACWLRVLAGEVDADAVTAAAGALSGIGLEWDAARLAGQAAIRTGDRRAMATLLAFARALQPNVVPAEPPSTPAPAPRPEPARKAQPPTSSSSTSSSARSSAGPDAPGTRGAGATGAAVALPRPRAAVLSGRELEVAALLIQGLTYKQIGERLFISAKTVEHHIARIRRRLGDPNRRDLIARLRTLLTTR